MSPVCLLLGLRPASSLDPLSFDNASRRMLRSKVRIPHRCMNVGMAHQLLNRFDIDPAHDPLAGPEVPEVSKGDPIEIHGLTRRVKRTSRVFQTVQSLQSGNDGTDIPQSAEPSATVPWRSRKAGCGVPFWLIASAAVTGSAMAPRFQQQRYSRDLRPKHLRVSILNAHQYSGKLDELVYEGLRLFKLKVRGKSVLLKPNIVEYIPGRPVNTDPQLIGATAEAFLRLGAASVKVAKGLVIIGTQNSLFTKLASPISSCTERFPSSISIATNS
jgi:hypothetical protein